ncbi:glycosyltransferase [bacterium]|nr:glycosyltransferase [bacterium]
MIKDVSIIILNHNGEDFLSNCLDSLVKLDYPKDKYEIIIVDNNSNDGSVELIEKNYGDVRIIKNHVNMGFGKANNLAVREISSDYIAFLNNDVRVEKDWLSNLVNSIDEDNKIVCAGAKILNWDGTLIDFAGGNINFMGAGVQRDYNKAVSETHIERGYIPFACGGSMLISRDVFIDIGCFDEDYTFYNEDTDLGWRLWLYGYKVILEPEAVSYHQHHGTGDKVLTQTHKRAFCDRNALYSMFKNLEEKNLGKFLPLSLLTGILRIPAMAGIDTSSFFFDPANSKNNKPPDVYNIRSHDMSFIAAVEDFARNLPKLMEKRKVVQKRRVISDEDLFSKFDGFFNTGYFSYNYWEEYKNLLQVIDTDDFIQDLKIRQGLFEDVVNEQIELQKEHIKHLEGLIFKKDKIVEPLEKEIEAAKKVIQDLKGKNAELESFALKVHKNPFFKIYANLKKYFKTT